LKKYNIHITNGKVSDITSKPNYFQEFKNNYQKIKDALNAMVTDSQAEKEFLISYFDYVYYT
jgi:hypothetical protein